MTRVRRTGFTSRDLTGDYFNQVTNSSERTLQSHAPFLPAISV
jgi:hypothetical protein